MKLRDEVLIQVRIKSDDLSRATLSDLAELLIAWLTISIAILKLFADLAIGIVQALEWLAGTIDGVPTWPARLWGWGIKWPLAVG